VKHRVRAKADPRFPFHVTVRMRKEVPRLRKFELCKFLRRAFVKGCKKPGFRICQFSIQGNHIHLVCEARSADARARGIQGWSVRMTHAINKFFERRGQVFDDRYHFKVMTTPTQTRNTLCYVLQNGRRHDERLDPRFHGADPFSSAWWFDGWKNPRWKLGLDPPEERTVALPESWLLRVGWQRAKRGLIAIHEVPPAAKY
jgi:REP element-mobilizing transposase RayT